MEAMRDSIAVPWIVRMVIRFHPLLTVTRLIYWVILLQDWIEEKVSNQWKALKVYFQSTMRSLLDPIIEKMKNLSKVLEMHLHNEAAKGQLKAKLVGKLAMFSAIFLLENTELSSKYDGRGVKVQLLTIIGLGLLRHSKPWSQFKILLGRYNCMVNSTSNFIFFIIALLFAKFYDNSLRGLSAMLCISVFLLCVLVVSRPQTDLGLFNFVIGVIGSITYNRYELNFPTWIIASICFVSFSFKNWLDKYWLDLEEDPCTNTTIESVSVLFIFSSTVTCFANSIFISSTFKSSLSNYKNGLVKATVIVLYSLCKFYNNSQDSSMPSTNTKGISGLVLTVVNIAQGMFKFALITFPMANYKDWLFIVISYVIFCFWLQSFFPKDMFLLSTNTKGIKDKIWAMQSIAKYGIVVLAGFEPRVYYREWLVTVTCYVFWWVQLRMSFPKDLSLLFNTIEFKAQWWILSALVYMLPDVISWIKLSRTTYHRQLQV
ncbi:hypothetical protein SLEP1_g54830 [Rubroshorea leprosula]|uniref:Uncharacterized protein n=1 Tax=Rubroshorea leprosula TaxID=152421 RepID=A0AAV5MHN7_9ROSI|nr:hypothetical protein SLEP1_g26879 [Rubroshorea leprosula]GKV47982.1 hypothetical protein SLEP1_g54830 [Rubroshorea leprosula]